MSLGGSELLVGGARQIVDPATNNPAKAPEDLIGWLETHPGLNTGPSTPIEISGITARYVDINPSARVDVFYDPLGNFHVGPGPIARFYAVPLDGPDLFIAVLRSPSGGELEEALASGTPVVESIEIVD